jgi:LPXTG-site transpeptidase (sortase) family protein
MKDQKNTHISDVKKSKSRKNSALVLIVIAGLLLGLGVYILALLLTPKLQKKSAQEFQKTQEQLQKSDKNLLTIKSAGVATEISEGDVNVLDKGLVWHRLPKEGNPEVGGNMILTGHSFVWGYTPKQVKENSIFYNLGDAKVGDPIEVRWNGKSYNYKVSETKQVKPNQIEIEKPSKDPKLTIYTCTLAGSADGRVVVIAVPSS